MTAPRTFLPHNPLADRLNDRRGLNALEAMQAGHAAVRALEPRMVAAIDRALGALGQECATYRSGAGAFDPVRLYGPADAIAGLAAGVRRARLGEAAASLCRLLADDRGARPEAIAVHIEALALIRRDEGLGVDLLPGLGLLNTSPCES